ncbi:hypothetical protein P0E52_09850 [Enterococcus faecalis]|uniref:hypothetical protein n=1 Tax=Enterococcus TaxID=1350 RepID=UPI00192776D0|nr:hypothetical protein [Enterococcus faecalis]MDN3114295.1 hypothetical protein [Enterococcus faecalis]HBC4464416.1 hypothetical protein [Enterococcus faecalis]
MITTLEKNYPKYLLQLLNEDESYQLIRNKISLVQEEAMKIPTQANKENLKELKYQLAEYVHTKIFELGFFEGVNYCQSRINTI